MVPAEVKKERRQFPPASPLIVWVSRFGHEVLEEIPFPFHIKLIRHIGHNFIVPTKELVKGFSLDKRWIPVKEHHVSLYLSVYIVIC